MNTSKLLLCAGLAAAAMLAGPACATPVNYPPYYGEPPPPNWILNLDGQPNLGVNGQYVQYTAIFFAGQTTTHITIGLTDSMQDLFFLDNVVVASLTNPGVNLVRNGGFEDGTAPSGGNPNAPVDWRYWNPYEVSYQSSLWCDHVGQGGSNCAWAPGFDQAYDFISQPIATVVGDWYQVSFWAQGPEEGNHWQGVNQSCCFPRFEGDSFNIVVYAGRLPTGAAPEPSVSGMFGLGLLLIGGFFVLRRREQQRQA